MLPSSGQTLRPKAADSAEACSDALAPSEHVYHTDEEAVLACFFDGQVSEVKPVDEKTAGQESTTTPKMHFSDKHPISQLKNTSTDCT